MSSRSFWNPGLRLRILAPAALVALPAIAVLVYMSFDRRMQAERAITENAERLARLSTIDQERLIEGTRQLLLAVSESRDIRDGNVEGCRAYLSQLAPQ